ncbi:hypothetical protein PTSG_05745 [Salpingoeca rosetta]|uniref:SAM domain-containing protein n=1 Tax=Salpingoeca rosetta (strain ATCC 50818 / BSB-021) TaxID=946362 RepID=F2UB40_SALR5|nr:uncharacterized protein PTSG_05745 [Salpingoeca rosetta]EGD74053.1 hypothetical protein PTSG_05745 [Salpingoeca rosetta]|eukprot:XP_004993615.1 hypothetical protein PTSG_05745 [Salpingoeca rosetta]
MRASCLVVWVAVVVALVVVGTHHGCLAFDCETHSLADATRMLQTQRCQELEVTHSATVGGTLDSATLDAFVAALAENRDVRKVELADNAFGDEGVQKVMGALLQRELDLYSLELEHNDITDAGLEAVVEFLRKSSALRKLKLGHNALTDAGASLLAEALPNQLHELDLSFNNIGDAGLLSLLHAASTTMLRELELEHNAVTDQGAAAAASLLLESDDSLRELDLDYNHLHADGLAALADCQQQRTDRGHRIHIKIKTGDGDFSKKQPRRYRSVKRSNVAAGWDEQRVKQWVSEIHPQFRKYGALMTANAVNGDVLAGLTDIDLQTMGVDNAMHRRRLLAEIRRLTSYDEL